MLPGQRCAICTLRLEQVSETAWMCVPCRRNVYWFGPLEEEPG